ncbi:hypothetical protein H5410_037414 [Solanum commersonii]|uniref:Uncharacterized protein n=1 Tax=Solanum commersonii TaxID=4109 RepID=A0A9J5YB59_SOLCO|nr:hypothetical protein H5410_037414 [Solanum commersonii]
MDRLCKEKCSLERFNLHVGEVNSVHNRCFNKMLNFENQSHSIQAAFNKQSKKTRSEHQIRLGLLLKWQGSSWNLDCFFEVMMKVSLQKIKVFF